VEALFATLPRLPRSELAGRKECDVYERDALISMLPDHNGVIERRKRNRSKRELRQTGLKPTVVDRCVADYRPLQAAGP
jgi:hypothetical protein